MSAVPRINVDEDPLAGRPAAAEPPAAAAPADHQMTRQRPESSLPRYPEANISVRGPAAIANSVKIAAAMLSTGPGGKVKVAELVNAVLLEHVDYTDPAKLEHLGELVHRYRSA
jgi:hypothetical protein